MTCHANRARGRYESYEGINVRLRCARAFEPHAACQPRAAATVAKPRLPTSRRSYFLRVSVNRNYSGKLVHEETFRVQAPPAATLATAALVPPPTHKFALAGCERGAGE